MNNLETLIPFMKQLHELLEKKSKDINQQLSAFEVRKIDIENSLTRIEEQISSADMRYTIAFVGTFNTGKSTIINSLLNLRGNARLSSESDPDTAKCIRLMYKDKGQSYDTEIVFTDTYPPERMNWVEAKKYTSHSSLDGLDSETQRKSEKIDEIRYYIDNSFLKQCNILDLPGTGTGLRSDDTFVTDKKIMDADCIFWVVSTDVEPDKEDILNLEKFSTKMLPIINVWQSETEDVYSALEPEYIKDLLQSQFETYFASSEEPVFYYAQEIDLAQQQERELKPEWGKMEFAEKVEKIISKIHTGDRMLRIKKQVSKALQECSETLEKLISDPALNSLVKNEKNETHEIRNIYSKLKRASDKASGDIKIQARKSAQEIIDIFSDASDAFIENQMQGINWTALFRKRNFQDELKKDFEKNYVKINDGWLDNIVNEFLDDVLDILRGIYADFTVQMSISSDNDTFTMGESCLSGFIDSMADIMGKDMEARIAPTIIAAIAGGIMLLVPGGAIFEALSMVVVGGITATIGITKDDKLRMKITSVKNAAKVQIKQQKATVVTNMREAGIAFNDDMFRKIEDELNKRTENNNMKKSQLDALKNAINNMIAFVNEQSEALNTI